MNKLDGAGYRHIFNGTFVPEEDVFDYALENCISEPVDGLRQIKWTDEFREMLVTWFYSDNWIWEDGHGTD